MVGGIDRPPDKGNTHGFSAVWWALPQKRTLTPETVEARRSCWASTNRHSELAPDWQPENPNGILSLSPG
jgi:hypothetical protein